MNRTAAAIMAALGCVLVALSAVVAYRFGGLLGATPQDALLLGAICVALGVTKSFLPFSLNAAWRTRAPVMGCVAAAALVATVASSLVGSFGLNAAQRAATASAVVVTTPHRPASVIEPLLHLKHTRLEQAQLQSEYAAALEAEHVRPNAAAQVAYISSTLHWDPATVQFMLAVLFAASIELCELLCFYAAAVMWRREPDPKVREPLPVAEEPIAEPVTETVTPMTETVIPLPVKRQRFDLVAWCREQLTHGESGTAEAYATYVAERKKARRRPVSRASFIRTFDAVATEVGARRRTVAGRVHYLRAA